MVVEVAGDIDMTRSVPFQHELLALLPDSPQRVVVDLTDVPYMDSSGVASLVKLLSRARTAGKSVSLAGLNPRVRSIFKITRLDKVFEIHDTAQEAGD